MRWSSVSPSHHVLSAARAHPWQGDAAALGGVADSGLHRSLLGIGEREGRAVRPALARHCCWSLLSLAHQRQPSFGAAVSVVVVAAAETTPTAEEVWGVAALAEPPTAMASR